jgi:signal transduction histidine kinase
MEEKIKMGQVHQPENPLPAGGDLQARYEALAAAHRRLQETERLRHDLLNMLVHDLKAPLNVILSSLDLFQLEPEQSLDPVQQEILDIVRCSGEEMLHLVTNLLELQRLESGKMPVHLQPVDIGRLLRTTVDRARWLAGQNRVALDLHLPESLPWAWADAHLTGRVMMNLVDNAIKNTPAEGQVCIAGQGLDRETIVSVADNGPGLPSSHTNRLFDPFFQAGPGTLNGGGSVGLGLAFCKMAVEAQQGWIEAGSRPGAGALFRFGLPLWPAGAV